MSYNISHWETATLENLTIPLSAFAEQHIKWGPDNTVSIRAWEGGAITGTVEDGVVKVSQIRMYGEGSGTDYRYIVLPALERSKGKLTAFLTWEGGDSFSLLEVLDGNVRDEDVSPVELLLRMMGLEDKPSRGEEK